MSKFTMATQVLEADPAEEAWVFRVDLKNESIEVEQHYEGQDYLDAEAELSVQWQADFDVRSWGIKEILPIIKSVTGSVVLTNEPGEEVQRIPISWPNNPTARDVQRVMGAPVPAAQANPRDWVNYYGTSQEGWTVEPEADYQQSGIRHISLAVKSATINIKERTIKIVF